MMTSIMDTHFFILGKNFRKSCLNFENPLHNDFRRRFDDVKNFENKFKFTKFNSRTLPFDIEVIARYYIYNNTRYIF